jgi:hypothetical protein
VTLVSVAASEPIRWVRDTSVGIRGRSRLAARLLRGHRPDWLAERLAELDAGNIPALLAAGRSLRFIGCLATERDKALAYFEANAHRMRYEHFRSWACSSAPA